MPFKVISSAAQADGKIQGVDAGGISTSTNVMVLDGDVLVTVALTPTKTYWNDYGTAPLEYSMTIVNGEAYDFTAPIEVEIGDFDTSLVDYVSGSATSSDNTVSSVNYDAGTGKLTFSLDDDIALTSGEATVTFQMQKPAVVEP